MADIYSIWSGNGSDAQFRIIDNNNPNLSVAFPDSKCILTYKKLEIEDTNIEEEIDEIVLGHRAFLDVDILGSKDSTGYVKYITLINILDNKNFTIEPFYNENYPHYKLIMLNSYYRMKEISDFSITHVHRFLEGAQELKLKFKARKLVQSRPTKHNDYDKFTILGLRYGHIIKH